MIKSEFGKIEVDGREQVVMAEFESLLVVLRRALGEEKYNLALQRASNKELTEKGKEKLRKGKKVIKAILSEKEDK